MEYTTYIAPLKYREYGVYEELTIILVNSIFYLLKGDYMNICEGYIGIMEGKMETNI